MQNLIHSYTTWYGMHSHSVVLNHSVKFNPVAFRVSEIWLSTDADNTDDTDAGVMA